MKREIILKSIVDALEPLDYVNAMWQCGSAAFGRVDEWSDIDIVLDVEDDRIMDVFHVTDKALEALAPVEGSFGCPQPMSPGAYQKVYKLEGTSEYLVIEICAAKNSSTEKFLQREIHGDIFVHFDKKAVTVFKPMDMPKFVETLGSRLNQTENLFKLYQFLIKKELNRSNHIEALAFYQRFTLSLLLEVLRMKHCPLRYSFGTRYVYYDLPKDVSARLHGFYFIKDSEELREKHELAVAWFHEVVSELHSTGFSGLLV